MILKTKMLCVLLQTTADIKKHDIFNYNLEREKLLHTFIEWKYALNMSVNW